MSPPLQSHTYSSALDIVDPFEGVLLDAYGVFWGGKSCGLFPGSKEVMETLVSSNKIVGILSNSTQRSQSEMSKLKKHGLIQGIHYHFLITSGEIAKQTFASEKLPFETPKKKFWLFGGIHPHFSSPLGLFEGSPYTETKDVSCADFIYISIPHVDGEDQTDPTVFLEEVKQLRETNLPMVCANPDRFAHEGSPPRAVVRQGSIAQLYEDLGGHVVYIGKPYAAVYTSALAFFEKEGISRPEKIVMIGDTPETDIRGANTFGLASALTTKTGIMAERIQKHYFEKKHVQLPLSDTPQFFIERL